MMKIKDADGTTRTVKTIASNRDHVGNLIAEGLLPEADRLDAIVRLYEAQRAVDRKVILALQEKSAA